ncbi:hypothetical protein CTI12_AA494640 [Artemisia annua]|uniref:Protein kinase domain-containing protein n=1 Tax=Artemisia annua TaxID=35608 RepID=A0A2U1LGA5_ARTAN|nr:hypothetical protein CTI12_AA494640 [Artemisia annua]
MVVRVQNTINGGASCLSLQPRLHPPRQKAPDPVLGVGKRLQLEANQISFHGFGRDQRFSENGEYEMANADKLKLEQRQRRAHILLCGIRWELRLSASKEYYVNSLAVPRKAKDATQSITKVSHTDGTNILIDNEGNLKLLDFGLSKPYSKEQEISQIMLLFSVKTNENKTDLKSISQDEVELPLKSSETEVSKTEVQTQPSTDRVIKLTFQMKRKRGAMIDGSGSSEMIQENQSAPVSHVKIFHHACSPVFAHLFSHICAGSKKERFGRSSSRKMDPQCYNVNECCRSIMEFEPMLPKGKPRWLFLEFWNQSDE